MVISNESKDAIRQEIRLKQAQIVVVNKEITGLTNQATILERRVASFEEQLSQVLASKQNQENKKAQLQADIQKLQDDIA